jgi:hypothetical protein
MAKALWTGLDDIENALLTLPKLMSDDLRSAANTGATIVKNEVVRRAPEDKGILKSAIYQKHIPELSSPDRQVYYVSWRKGKNSATDAYYGVWVEYGHWYVPEKGSGVRWKPHREQNRTVFVPAHPYLRPGFEASKNPAIVAMRETLAINVQKTIAEFYKND